MLLEITTTHRPATDLGYLLHKNPGRAHSLELAFGVAHVFYPEATEDRCTAALLLEVDPVGLSRDRKARSGFVLQPYVNDRPYVASSFMSVAISRAFGTALGGRSKERPELASTPIPLHARIAAVPGSEALVRRLFTPLGWTVELEAHPVDPAFPEWGTSVHTLEIQGVQRVADLLGHVRVLLPVLDDDKHYWVGDDEVEKLLRFGAGWLASHPEKDLIARRYLRHQRSLVQSALDRLWTEETAPAPKASTERAIEKPIRLNDARKNAVIDELHALGAKRVIDLGCGDGRLVRALAKLELDEIAGVDVSHRSLERAAERLDRLPDRKRQRVRLMHGSLVYRDRRFAGYDAATLIEVIEHLDPFRIPALEDVLFGHARPGAVIVTTPNVEHNVRFERLTGLRHPDHRFEWTRAQFAAWAEHVCARFGYRARIAPIGEEDPVVGAPTQMAVLTR